MPPSKKRAPRKKAVPKEAPEPEETLFDDEPPLPAPIPESPLTEDLTDEEKKEFARLLRQKMSLSDRADMLVRFARMDDTKRAPVGLRAIQEINKITGVTNEASAEATPMFVLPANTAIAVRTFEPEE